MKLLQKFLYCHPISLTQTIMTFKMNYIPQQLSRVYLELNKRRTRKRELKCWGEQAPRGSRARKRRSGPLHTARVGRLGSRGCVRGARSPSARPAGRGAALLLSFPLSTDVGQPAQSGPLLSGVPITARLGLCRAPVSREQPQTAWTEQSVPAAQQDVQVSRGFRRVPEGSSSLGGGIALEVDADLVPPSSHGLLILSLKWKPVTVRLTWYYARSVSQVTAVRASGKPPALQGLSPPRALRDLPTGGVSSEPAFYQGHFERQSRWGADVTLRGSRP